MTESINAIAGPSRSPTTRENEHITEGERPGSVDDHHHPSPSRQSTRTVRPLESDDEGLGDEDDKLRDTREYVSDERGLAAASIQSCMETLPPR